MQYAGVDYRNIEELSINLRMNNRSGFFRLMLPNDRGVYKTTFTIGQDITIYCDSNSSPTTKIFTGVIEDIEFLSPDYNREFITLSGRDYTARLLDVTALETYNNSAPETIIQNLIDKYVTGVTYNNVAVTGTTITHLTFKHKSIFECIRIIAELIGYSFWIDVNKDLHLERESTVASGYVLDNSNIIGTATFETDREELFNEVWVYGGRYLGGFREDKTGDGVGSVFTMQYKPHNTYVTVAGTKKLGGIYQMSNVTLSGTQYLVDYDQKGIIFVSGTSTGNNIPGSLSAIVIQYDRDLPIVKFTKDNSSIESYKKRVKIIQDSDIDSPLQALDVAKSYLNQHKDPVKMGRLRIKAISSLTIGNTIVVNLPNQNISSENFKIIETNYSINKANLLNEAVLDISVSQRIKDIVDIFGQMIKDIKQLQGDQINTSDTLTRYDLETGSAGFKTAGWYLRTRTLGSSFVLSHPIRGLLGSNANQSYLGDSRGAAVIAVSGGF